MNTQTTHYENKWAFEIDFSDLFEALNEGDKLIVIDATKATGCEAELFQGQSIYPIAK